MCSYRWQVENGRFPGIMSGAMVGCLIPDRDNGGIVGWGLVRINGYCRSQVTHFFLKARFQSKWVEICSPRDCERQAEQGDPRFRQAKNLS